MTKLTEIYFPAACEYRFAGYLPSRMLAAARYQDKPFNLNLSPRDNIGVPPIHGDAVAEEVIPYCTLCLKEVSWYRWPILVCVSGLENLVEFEAFASVPLARKSA